MVYHDGELGNLGDMMSVASMQERRTVRSYLFGGNAPYIEQFYEAYLDNPESVPDNWRTYFDALQNLPHDEATDSGDMARPMFLPVNLPKDADPAAVSSMVEAIEKAIVVLVGTGQTSVLKQADRLAQLATGMLEPSIELVEDRVHRMKTVRQVFAEGDWITAEQINALQAEPPANKAHPASDWKRRGRVFSVNHSGKEYFARYQFDALYQPLSIVKAWPRPATLTVMLPFPSGTAVSTKAQLGSVAVEGTSTVFIQGLSEPVMTQLPLTKDTTPLPSRSTTCPVRACPPSNRTVTWTTGFSLVGLAQFLVPTRPATGSAATS